MLAEISRTAAMQREAAAREIAWWQAGPGQEQPVDSAVLQCVFIDHTVLHDQSDWLDIITLARGIKTSFFRTYCG